MTATNKVVKITPSKNNTAKVENKTTTTNPEKKGGNIMTTKDALKKFQAEYNDYQRYIEESNKKLPDSKRRSYKFADTSTIVDFAKGLKPEELTQLVKCYNYIRKLHKQLGNYVWEQYKENKLNIENTADREKIKQLERELEEMKSWKQQFEQAEYVARQATRKKLDEDGNVIDDEIEESQ